MLKRKWVAAKLFAALGGVGLAFGLCVPRASAANTSPDPNISPGSFSNANYLNRYICNESADGNLFTALIRLRPNGSGAFEAGVMQAPISADGGAIVGGNPPNLNFCEFDLNTNGSAYVVGTNGVGVEVLSWTAAATNSAGCATPYATATFSSSDTFVLRNQSRASGASISDEITSDNLLNQGATAATGAGYGSCSK